MDCFNGSPAEKENATFKTLTISASTSFAFADSYISNFVMEQDRSPVIELGTVRAEGNGVGKVYSFHKGKVGTLLRSEAVMTDANPTKQTEEHLYAALSHALQLVRNLQL